MPRWYGHIAHLGAACASLLGDLQARSRGHLACQGQGLMWGGRFTTREPAVRQVCPPARPSQCNLVSIDRGSKGLTLKKLSGGKCYRVCRAERECENVISSRILLQCKCMVCPKCWRKTKHIKHTKHCRKQRRSMDTRLHQNVNVLPAEPARTPAAPRAHNRAQALFEAFRAACAEQGVWPYFVARARPAG